MAFADVTEWLKRNKWIIVLWYFVFQALVIGGLCRLRPEPFTTREVMYIRLLGDLWLSALRAVGLPLLVTSLACAIYELQLRVTVKYLLFIILWVVVSKVEVAALAAALSAAAAPGLNMGDGAAEDLRGTGLAPPSPRLTLGDAVLDTLRDLLPDNPVEACVRHAVSRLKEPNATEPGTGDPYDYDEADKDFVYQSDLLGVVVGTTAVAVAMALLGDKVRSLLEVSAAARDAFALLARWLLVPAGPCLSLVLIAEVAGARDALAQLEAMTAYVWSLAAALALQLALVYPVAYLALAARANWLQPARLFWHMSEALVAALASSSSHVAFPLARRCLVELHAAEDNSANMVLAVATALNSDGSAALLAAGGLWAAQQQRGEALPAGLYAGAVALACLGSVAAFGEARSHPHLLVMTVSMLGGTTRAQDIAPLLVLSWLMDPLASVVNVAGSVFAAATLAGVREKELQKEAA